MLGEVLAEGISGPELSEILHIDPFVLEGSALGQGVSLSHQRGFGQLGDMMLAAGLCQVLELLAVGVLHLLLDHELDRFVHKVELGDGVLFVGWWFWKRLWGSIYSAP